MPLQESPLSQAHDDDGANYTEVAGWRVPMEFDSIRTEHHAVRTAVGRFDVSHLGKLRVGGVDATTLVNRLVTNDVAALSPGQAQYACVLTDDGYLLDDVVVYALPTDEAAFLVVHNARHDDALFERARTLRDERDLDATCEDVTGALAGIAVQGPDAVDAVERALDAAVADLDSFEARYADVDGTELLVSRTGYTGEDGFELFPPREAAAAVWSAVECQPCGLGARETLRFEAGFVRSGVDFDRERFPRTPSEADLDHVVDRDTDFLGKAALEELSVRTRRVGIVVEGRGVPKTGDAIRNDGSKIGVVTSGILSPSLNESLGSGYVPEAFAHPGTRVSVDIRDRSVDGRIRDVRFLERPTAR
ncbi:MAG: glycine cleavage system aminomethyltransferase GcvT [Haloplanus sp.]